MGLRPSQAHLFEVFTPRQQTVHALEALANTDAVELEVNPKTNASLETRKTLDAIRQFELLAKPYRAWLPEREPRPQVLDEAPDQAALHAIDVLTQWISDIGPVLERLSALEAERDNLKLLQEYVASLGDNPKDLAPLSHQRGLLYKGLFACPGDQALDAEIEDVFEEVSAGENHRFLLFAGFPERGPDIDALMQANTCQRIEVPDWLAEGGPDRVGQVHSRLDMVENDLAALRTAVTHTAHVLPIAEALSNIALLKWYTRQAAAVTLDEKFCHVTGWTSFKNPGELEAALQAQNLQGIVRFLEPPGGKPPPLKTLDTWWARPFQPFISLYGTPGAGEVDPSLVLVFVVPLLFGYMFPDMGHGLVLILLSTALYRRWPEGRFLIPCGMASILFGWVFGDVFGFHDVVEPLWVKPLEDPLIVLTVPIALGVGLIVLGMLFSAVQFHWRGKTLQWLLSDAAILLFYLSALVAPFYAQARYAVAGALVWFFLGALILRLMSATHRLGGALLHLLESLFQLLVNTLSFLRVGAFALAHSGISAAVLLVAELMPNVVLFWFALVIGQIMLVSLEALVVFVQTTRLVFFEFFIRFLQAGGRSFSPLLPPEAPPSKPPG